jgi:hypothetical protein
MALPFPQVTAILGRRASRNRYQKPSIIVPLLPNTEMANIMHEKHCRTDHLAKNSDPVGPVIF